MIIGIDVSRINKKQKTGVEWYLFRLIQEMKKIPFNRDTEFVLYSPIDFKGDLANLPGNWRLKRLSWPLKYAWTQIRLCLEIFINRPNILFIPAHILPFFCPVKSVLVIHDLGFERFPEYYSFWQRIYYSWTHRYSFKKAAKIIVPSEFTKKEIIELYRVTEDKIEVIPEGYDRETFYLVDDKAKIASIRVKYGIKGSYFLYVGRLEKKKNVKGLIDAYKEFCAANIGLKNIPRLVLAGKKSFGGREIETAISGFESNILYLGYVHDKDLVYLYNGAEAFIFPSFYEGFGLPLIEAMACGCPVLTSNGASLPEVGGNAVVYFSPNNIKDMARVMEEFLKNEELKKEMVKMGLNRVAENFSWRQCAEKIIEVLANL